MYRTLDARLVVAVDGDDAGGGGGDELEGTVHLFKLANDVTYRRFAPARPRPPVPPRHALHFHAVRLGRALAAAGGCRARGAAAVLTVLFRPFRYKTETCRVAPVPNPIHAPAHPHTHTHTYTHSHKPTH